VDLNQTTRGFIATRSWHDEAFGVPDQHLRGPFDQPALARALEAKRIAGAALTSAKEPPDADDPVLGWTTPSSCPASARHRRNPAG
jgi:hypothetical protein